MKRTEIPTICIEFQGNEYCIIGEPVKTTDFVEHDVECPACKDAYPTYEAAQHELRQRTSRSSRNKRIYRCEFCGCYHFTSNDGYTHRRKYYDRTMNQEHLRRAVAYVSGSDLKAVKEVLSRPGSLKRFVNAQNLRNLQNCA